MGEYADMYLDGLFDMETGKLIDGEAPGHPRCARLERKLREAPKITCPICGKKVKAIGLPNHKRDKHGV